MIIFALGNPGKKYELTRHNVGEHIVHTLFPDVEWKKDNMAEALVAETSLLDSYTVLALNHDRYMNESGYTARALLKRFESSLKELVVVHDDIDLPFGVIKISHGRGPGGHNGVKSLIASFGTEDFTRIRVGIARKEFFNEDGSNKISTQGEARTFVLARFSEEEQKELPSISKRVGEILESLIKDGLEKTMEHFNRRD